MLHASRNPGTHALGCRNPGAASVPIVRCPCRCRFRADGHVLAAVGWTRDSKPRDTALRDGVSREAFEIDLQERHRNDTPAAARGGNNK